MDKVVMVRKDSGAGGFAQTSLSPPWMICARELQRRPGITTGCLRLWQDLSGAVGDPKVILRC
jgi:hypothetical protein